MTDVVISVQDVRYKYPTSKDWVLKGVNLDIRRGEFVGIVGTTGAGKTTLCQTFNGLIPHYLRGTFEGTVLVEGVDTCKAEVSDLSTKVGLVFQDADSQLVMSTVMEEVMLGLTMHGMPFKEARERARHTLEIMGIAHLADRPPHAVSGGQKQRVAIATVLALRPEILVLDEATSELDSLTVHRIFDLVRELNAEGITIVLVSHEMELLSLYADRLVLVDDGQVILEGPPREVFQQAEVFRRKGVRLPQVTDFALALADRLTSPTLPLTVDEAASSIQRLAGGAV